MEYFDFRLTILMGWFENTLYILFVRSSHVLCLELHALARQKSSTTTTIIVLSLFAHDRVRSTFGIVPGDGTHWSPRCPGVKFVSDIVSNVRFSKLYLDLGIKDYGIQFLLRKMYQILHNSSLFDIFVVEIYMFVVKITVFW